jgi:transposase
MARYQLISGPERRRFWSEEQKRALVAAAFAPGAIVAEVARRADVGPGQIYRWRRELRGPLNGEGFAEVVVTAAPGQGIVPCADTARAGGGGCAGPTSMIPIPSGVRVWLAVGRTDMRKGMNGLALQVQQALGRDPHAGDLYVFRGARGDLVKIVWHDGIGMSLYAKRLERGRFIWPSPADGVVAISAAQLAYMLDGIDWRNPVRTWRPDLAG